MKQFFALFLLVTTLFISSCDKDKALIDNLSGTWKLCDRKSNGVVQSLQGIDEKITYTFCDHKKEDKCPAKYAFVDSASISSRVNIDYFYSVDGKNKKITEIGTNTIVKTITSSSSSVMEVKYMRGTVAMEDIYMKQK